LQLLDLTGELADLALELVEANDEIGSRHLGRGRDRKNADESDERECAGDVLHEELPDCG
jgi:hypothetical protein